MLEELALTHELPRLDPRVARRCMKLKGTYIDALPLLVHPDTGPRAHLLQPGGRRDRTPEQLAIRTCRTSRSAPELGREIRRAFIADAGHVLISADYSQIELRVLAHLAGEKALIEAFRSGEDIHDRTALQGVRRRTAASTRTSCGSRVEDRQLRACCTERRAFTLAKDIGVTQEAAQEFIDAYFAGFPRVRAFIDQHARRGPRAPASSRRCSGGGGSCRI